MIKENEVIKELELVTCVEHINPEALEELSNGLGDDEDIEELVALARQHEELVGANVNDNYIFSPLCNVIIRSPNYNPRSDASKYGVTNNKIDTITIHHMAGNLTVETCGNIFARTSRQASSNYGVGSDGRIGGYCGEENRSWCSSSKYNDFRAVTIEVANNSLSPSWTVSTEALASTINLVVDICKRNGIEKLIFSENKNDRINHVNGCNLTYHCDFGKTACPGPYFKAIMSNLCLAVNNLLAQSPTPVPPTPIVNPFKKPTASVNSGSKGESVMWIQWQLNTYNYGLAVDGSYGPATTKAVKDFQSKHSLAVTGNCDLNTINVLDGGQPQPVINPYTKPTTPVNKGAKGDNVKWIQYQLNIYNYGLDIDGSYGPATTKAVSDFQKKYKLSVTGNCDMNTINVLDGGQPQPSPYNPPDPYMDYSKAFWDWFRTLGMPEYGVAGLIGNISMESAIRPNNLQNSFEKSLHMTDDQYTAAVDDGTYTNFINDGAGYGLAQWTYWTRKQGLFNFAKLNKMSICDINLQLTYLTQELQTKYKGVWDGLMKASSVYEASNIVLLQFEKPADQSEANQQRRATCCQGYYEKFKGSAITTTFPISNANQTVGVAKATTTKPYSVKITAQLLNVREGAGLDYEIRTAYRKNTIHKIINEKNGWGKLENGMGWIDLKYTKKI